MNDIQIIESEIRRFVVENFLFGSDSSFSNADSFLDKGLIDSIGVMTLVEHVKDQYAIVVEDEELIPDNWDSVARIANFVYAKRTADTHDRVEEPELRPSGASR